MQLSKHFARSFIVALVLAVGLPSAAWTKDILTVENAGAIRNYTAGQLLSLPQTVVITKNDYVNSVSKFSGPSLKLILKQNDIGPGAKIKLNALNNFSNTIPASDAYQYNVILALRMNGKIMSVRNKGPIWVIYPMDEHPELKSDMYNGRMVWQLREIIAK